MPPISSAYEFVALFGRMPMLDKGEKPWQYRGWLRMYVQEIHRVHPAVPDRWGYLFQCLEDGRLPRDPIPPIEFLSEPHPDGLRQLKIGVELIAAAGHSPWGALERMIAWLLWGLDGPGPRYRDFEMPKLPDKTAEALYRQLDFGQWLLHPYDYLGHFIATEGSKGWNPHAFYPTPMSLVRLMTMVTFGENGERVRTAKTDPRLWSCCDPAVGTGRFLLAASNYTLALAGQDIDPMMVDCCMINGMFYAPWMCFSIHDKLRSPLKIAPARKVPAKKKIPPPRKGPPAPVKKKTPPPKKR